MGISGALIIPLTKEFGWSTEQISVALAMRIVLFGLMAPFTAALIDKYGFKRVLLFALSLIDIGLIGALVMTRLWQLVLFWGVIVGFGTGLTAMVLVAIVAARWFTARRGLAVGILSASIASGQLLFLPLAAWLADRYGWRARAGSADFRPVTGRTPRRSVPRRQAGGCRPQAVWRQRRHAGPCRAGRGLQSRFRSPVRVRCEVALSGCWQARSSSAD